MVIHSARDYPGGSPSPPLPEAIMLERLIARIPNETRTRLEQARHDAWVKRSESRVRLWELSTRGLERAHDLLDEAPVGLVGPLAKLVDQRLAEATTPHIEGYGELNARNAAKAVRGLGLLDLERVVRYERATKNRKTVLDAVEREREKVLAAPEQAA